MFGKIVWKKSWSSILNPFPNPIRKFSKISNPVDFGPIFGDFRPKLAILYHFVRILKFSKANLGLLHDVDKIDRSKDSNIIYFTLNRGNSSRRPSDVKISAPTSSATTRSTADYIPPSPIMNHHVPTNHIPSNSSPNVLLKSFNNMSLNLTKEGF